MFNLASHSAPALHAKGPVPVPPCQMPLYLQTGFFSSHFGSSSSCQCSPVHGTGSNPEITIIVVLRFNLLDVTRLFIFQAISFLPVVGTTTDHDLWLLPTSLYIMLRIFQPNILRDNVHSVLYLVDTRSAIIFLNGQTGLRGK